MPAAVRVRFASIRAISGTPSCLSILKIEAINDCERVRPLALPYYGAYPKSKSKRKPSKILLPILPSATPLQFNKFPAYQTPSVKFVRS